MGRVIYFFVGVFVSAAAVTLYVIPYEVATQTLILAGALTTVIFPVVTNLIQQAPQQAMVVFHLWLGRIVGLMFVVLSLLAYSLPTLLHLWVGDQVTDESVRVGQILCVGVFFNTIGGMYFSLLHVRGWKANVLRFLVSGLYRLALGRGNLQVICQNPDDRKTLMQLTGLPINKVAMILGSGVDLSAYTVKPIPQGVPLVVMAARLLRDKGVYEFVAAATRLLRQRGVAARFWLAGEPDLATRPT